MSELTAEEREAALEQLRRRMGRALRRGETAEYERLAAAYATRKAEHAAASLAEYQREVRARRAVREAERAREASSRPWRLPRGFGASPLVAQRAREGADRGLLVPDSRRPALSPWRGGHPAAEVIWRPGG